MSELRTLKDIPLPSDGCNCEDIIRQEAIKWLKETKFSEEIKKEFGDIDFLNEIPTRDWIKHFFGIEDKDLE
jgi:hypothetical protein